MDQSSRGQTAVLGVVLLVGIVAIGSVGLMVYAGQATSGVQQQTENERVEQAFVELSQRMATTSTSSDASQSIDLSVDQKGAIVKKDTGNIRIEGGDVDENLSIGSIEYEADDGTRLAYQAGAVFRETGNQTRIVSAPPIHYDEDAESLSFPVVTVSGETELNAGDVTISHEFTDPVRNASIVENDSVRITVTSKYYRGWEAYFERQAGEPVIRDVDHENQTVTAELGYLDVDTAFKEGMTISERYEDSGNPPIDQSDYEYGSLPELDSVIETMVEDMEDGEYGVDGKYTRINGDENLENGTYFVTDEVHLDESLEVNASEGDVTIVVNGSLTTNKKDLTVKSGGTDNELRIYLTDDVSISRDVCVDDCPTSDSDDLDAKQLQIYGTSETLASFGGKGTTTFEGTLYAASNREFDDNEIHKGNCDSQVCIQSSVDFYGSLVASSVEATGGRGSIDFAYDPELETVTDLYPEEYDLPPKLTYLNVAKHEVDVKNS